MCSAQVRGLFPLFSQLKAKDWGYLHELIPDQHVHKHWMRGLHVWAVLRSGAAAGGVLCGWSWLHRGVQQEPALFASITSDLLSAEATLDPSEKPLQPQVQKSYWERLSYKLVTDCGASAMHAIETNMFLDALGGNYWTSQWFGALYDHWCHWKWSPRIRYVLLWESTGGQGKVHVQSEIFSTSTQICTNLWSTTVKSAYLVLWWRFLLEWCGCVTTKGPTTAGLYSSESQMEDVWSMFGWLKCIEA